MTSLRTQVLLAARLRRLGAGRSRRAVAPEAERAAWRADRLAALRHHASERSPFYRRLHAGLGDASLSELPVVTKAQLIEHFDEVVTDRSVTLAEVSAFLLAARPGDRFRGRYWVGASSGATGRPGAFLFDEGEWVSLLAGSVAARRMAGPVETRGERVRSAKVASSSPWHLSSQLGSTLRDPRKPTLRLDAGSPLPLLVEELQRWRPHVLSGYPTILALLAEEQAAGRLAIQPLHVFSSAELLTGAARASVRRVWGGEPFDQFATTEAGTVAAECRAHAGLHVLDDDVILEVVDGHDRPAPPGTYGARALISVLASRTLPLVRYELDDSLSVVPGPCSCGRPSPRIVVGGRALDVLRLPGRNGEEVAVHPVVFMGVLDTTLVTAWQVVRLPDRLRLLVVGPRASFSVDEVGHAVRRSLATLGVDLPVEVEVVTAIARTGGGKASLVVDHVGGAAGSG